MNALIRQPESAMEAKLFAAQTFRQKIEFDIVDLSESQLHGLYF